MRSSCLFLDGLSGGNRSTSEARGEGVVNLLTTDKKQDENLWKKRINGILKWTVTRRGQELTPLHGWPKGHAVVRESEKSDTFPAWPQPESGNGVTGQEQ